MVMRALTRKLLRDVWHTRGQALAIALVLGAGVAMYVGYFSTFDSLRLARHAYYDRFRFADVFVSLERAPLSAVGDVAALPGVARAAPRVVVDVALDIPGLVEPATARLVSIPAQHASTLNEPYVRRGRRPEREDEILASEAFALAHGFLPGNRVRATINGRRRELLIVGVALSPEYIYSIRPGELVPDSARFGVFWMEERALAAAFNMEGAFNDLSLALMRGAIEPDVLAAVDARLARYGSLGAIARRNQLSHWFIENELGQLQTMGVIFPTIFLGVSILLLNIVLTRMVATQREQIAALKALGYRNLEIAWHYLSWALVVGAAGTVLGIVSGMWLGRSMVGLYNDLFHFPTLDYTLAPAVALQGTAISLVAAAIGGLSAVRSAVKLPPAEAMRPEVPSSRSLSRFDRMLPKAITPPTVRMIVRNLSRQPLRTLLSIVGMAMAAAILVVGLFSLDAIDVILDVQFNVANRQDFLITFVEPRSTRTVHEIARWPGVLYVEPVRSVGARIRAGHRVRQVAITGLPDQPHLQRVVDSSLHPIALPPDGLVLSRKLGEILHLRAGDEAWVEVLEGRRPIRRIRIAALADEYLGMGAYMQLDALRRLMRETHQISGVSLLTDGGDPASFYRRIKETPAIAGVSSTRAAIDNFRRTLAESMNVLLFFNALFSSIIAFGVVYNAARVSLSERSRDFASLRVLGFTRTEISMMLLGELAVIVAVAIPAGLILGYGLAVLAIATLDTFNTELYRMPLVVSARTFAASAATTIAAAVFSGLIVRRQLDRLDLVAVLKSRE